MKIRFEYFYNNTWKPSDIPTYTWGRCGDSWFNDMGTLININKVTNWRLVLIMPITTSFVDFCKEMGMIVLESTADKLVVTCEEKHIKNAQVAIFYFRLLRFNYYHEFATNYFYLRKKKFNKFKAFAFASNSIKYSSGLAFFEYSYKLQNLTFVAYINRIFTKTALKRSNYHQLYKNRELKNQYTDAEFKFVKQTPIEKLTLKNTKLLFE